MRTAWGWPAGALLPEPLTSGVLITVTGCAGRPIAFSSRLPARRGSLPQASVIRRANSSARAPDRPSGNRVRRIRDAELVAVLAIAEVEIADTPVGRLFGDREDQHRPGREAADSRSYAANSRSARGPGQPEVDGDRTLSCGEHAHDTAAVFIFRGAEGFQDAQRGRVGKGTLVP